MEALGNAPRPGLRPAQAVLINQALSESEHLHLPAQYKKSEKLQDALIIAVLWFGHGHVPNRPDERTTSLDRKSHRDAGRRDAVHEHERGIALHRDGRPVELVPADVPVHTLLGEERQHATARGRAKGIARR